MSNWEQKMGMAEPAKKDTNQLSPGQRRAGLYSAFLMLVLLGYFLYLQWTDTGFFTDEFKWPEMLALYVPILLSMAPPIQRYITGRRDSAHLLEAVADFSLAVGSLVLWIVFPFDFSHLADPLPANVQFLIGWINNNIARIILILQVIIGALSGIAQLRDYYRVKRKESTSEVPPG
jgi:type IV secretory pathway VirB2 component (pilin)